MRLFFWSQANSHKTFIQSAFKKPCVRNYYIKQKVNYNFYRKNHDAVGFAEGINHCAGEDNIFEHVQKENWENFSFADYIYCAVNKSGTHAAYNK